jgi:hypothetical protein
LEDGNSSSDSILGDQNTVEGLFQNFKYAYSLKDTLLYGKLLSGEFSFVYRDYDKGVDITWGRDEDVQITNRLFQNSQSCELTWNNIFVMTGDSTNMNVVRFFNLSITFSPDDVTRVDGKVNLIISRESEGKPWKIKNWRDESDY